MAKIQLNGKKINISSKLCVLDVLKKSKLDKKRIAIELNGSIVSKSDYHKQILKNKDRLEVVHFIGGG